jgi:hypothetical protein
VALSPCAAVLWTAAKSESREGDAIRSIEDSNSPLGLFVDASLFCEFVGHRIKPNEMLLSHFQYSPSRDDERKIIKYFREEMARIAHIAWNTAISRSGV